MDVKSPTALNLHDIRGFQGGQLACANARVQQQQYDHPFKQAAVLFTIPQYRLDFLIGHVAREWVWNACHIAR